MSMNLDSLNEFTICFLEYVLFRPWVDDHDDSLVVCSQAVMHGLDDTFHLMEQKRPEVQERLEDLQHVLRDILPFEIIPPDATCGRATCIRPEVHPELGSLIEQRKLEFLNGGGVAPLTLLPKPPLTATEREISLKKNRAEGRIASATAPKKHPLYEELQQLNSRKPHSFARLEDNRAAAIVAARSLPSERKAIFNLDILNRLPHWQAFYATKSGSPRLYTVGGGLQLLSKKVRQAVFGEALHFDLAAAQLAVIARIWGAHGLQEKLTSKGLKDAWSVVVEPLQAYYPYITKEHLKPLIYPLIFGMGKKKLADAIQKRCHLTFDDFFAASEIMQELLETRQARMDRIKEEGQIIDAFGNRHKFIEPHFNNQYSGNLRGLLAYEAQSYEVALMKPAIQYTLGKKYCSLDLLIHDGIVVKVTDSAKRGQGGELGPQYPTLSELSVWLDFKSPMSCRASASPRSWMQTNVRTRVRRPSVTTLQARRPCAFTVQVWRTPTSTHQTYARVNRQSRRST
ncbi:hypothetical protein [Deinococcus aquatilis]|uniref:hypothetical protein n=1 Tax=Deinococcus aquatilis TaxID=519440 RepID=UPI000374FDE6|nr:hypothetical protein [Deinococcus aquatilis]